MPQRLTPLVTDQYYHIFNRGVARLPIFLQTRDYRRFLETVDYYRHNKVPIRFSQLHLLPQEVRTQILDEVSSKLQVLVDVLSFVLMPNHFHFLIKQNLDGGISKFLNLITNSYVRYFNTKHDRVGPLFQGMFKAVRIETDEQLVHVSRYIHLNPLTSYLVKEEDFLDYRWSSLPAYMEQSEDMVNVNIILSQFKNSKNYLKFVLDQKDYARELKNIEHLTLEN